MAHRLSQHEFPASSIISSGQTPVFWERTAGANIEDVDGNLYVDLTAGFCVAVAGHSNPRISRAIGEQARQMMHNQGGLNPNPQRVLLSEKLAAIAPPGLSANLIASTGAEAVDVAIKTARLYTGRTTIIAFQQGFHGKTLGVLPVTSVNYYREPFVPTLYGAVHIPYANCYRCVWGRQLPDCELQCAEYLNYVLDMPDSGVADVAAVIMEPVQGHGGWNFPPKEFVQRVGQICDQHHILLIADEIITAFGRTGYPFGMDYYGVTPDIMVVAKGLASGFPISAVLARPEIAAAWKPMQHSSTFVGNPVGCAAALASLAEIEDRQLVQRSREIGDCFIQAFSEMQRRHPSIGDVRGRGSMFGLELVKDRDTKEPASDFGRRVVNAALERGVMATNYGGTYQNVIKLSPPLVITQPQLEKAIEILEESFTEVEATGGGKQKGAVRREGIW
jgi:4-aminobutyrate aminotransferase